MYIFIFALIIYRFFAFLATPIVILFLYCNNYQNLAYRKRILEHLGFFSRKLKHQKSIWITASSLGESLIVIDLLEDLRKLPFNIIITTNDFASYKKLEPHLTAGVYHSFLPLDNYLSINYFIRQIKPALFITIEREFFPETILSVKNYGASLLLINSRLSNKSSAIYLRFRTIFTRLYSLYDHILVQYQIDFDNYVKFVNKKKLTLGGNLKFIRKVGNVSPLLPNLKEKEEKEKRKIICFGSIRDGEEVLIIKACQKILQKEKCLFILAPRYLRQIENIENILQKSDNYKLVSSLPADIGKSVFLILDSIGNLMSAYASSDIAFVGGSLVSKYGGHNILEPISLGKPTIISKNYSNFQSIVDELAKKDAISVCNPEDLASTILSLIANPSKTSQMISNATTFLTTQTNAKSLTLDTIDNFLVKKVRKKNEKNEKSKKEQI